jgi:hypothetical protein
MDNKIAKTLARLNIVKFTPPVTPWVANATRPCPLATSPPNKGVSVPCSHADGCQMTKGRFTTVNTSSTVDR